MQAGYRPIGNKIIKVVIVSHQLPVTIDTSKRVIGRYKKVGKDTKQALIDMVSNGCSIISAAYDLKINYSTAKSIIQNNKLKQFKNQKLKAISTDQSTSNHGKNQNQMKQSLIITQH